MPFDRTDLTLHAPGWIFTDFEQGTPEWDAVRLGKVTASRIADVCAKGQSGKPSATRAKYMAQLVVERLTGAKAENGYRNAAMDRGNEVEALARRAYTFYNNAPVDRIAFVNHPGIPLTGASPDGWVGDEGIAEIKCPDTHTHLETLETKKIPGDYLKQMLWNLACTTGRKWVDYISYDDRLPPNARLCVIRVERDDDAIKAISDEVRMFLAELDAKESKVRSYKG
jgi:putative phage-type endonuclease